MFKVRNFEALHYASQPLRCFWEEMTLAALTSTTVVFNKNGAYVCMLKCQETGRKEKKSMQVELSYHSSTSSI